MDSDLQIHTHSFNEHALAGNYVPGPVQGTGNELLEEKHGSCPEGCNESSRHGREQHTPKKCSHGGISELSVWGRTPDSPEGHPRIHPVLAALC